MTKRIIILFLILCLKGSLLFAQEDKKTQGNLETEIRDLQEELTIQRAVSPDKGAGDAEEPAVIKEEVANDQGPLLTEPPASPPKSSQEPIEINGDKVEYTTDVKEVVASGNVEVTYKGSTLSCQKLTVNTLTKDCIAEGNARLNDKSGILSGEKIIFNFEQKTGTVIDAHFMANPYFGRARKIEKVSDTEFFTSRGFATTCNLDQPHYRIASQKIKVFPGNKIQTNQDTFYIGKIPILYLEEYNHSLLDPMMHVSFMPGTNKDWGGYLLSNWRYNLTPNMNGRVNVDYRSKLGMAEGFGLNYNTVPNFGKGDLKFYYTNESPNRISGDVPKEYERYLARLRHKWDIDKQTKVFSEIYKITDKRRKLQDPERNILKDYFYREYEKDSQPLSYALFHHSFPNSTFDFLIQKRMNNWFDQLDKLPEIKFSLPYYQILDTPFYFNNSSSFVVLNKKATTAPVSDNPLNATRLDTLNNFSLPLNFAFLHLSPFIGSRQTFYDRSANNLSRVIRTVFYSGADLSAKFFRLYNVKSRVLKMEIDGLRHVITPSISYNYNHTPTIPQGNLKQIDAVDAIAPNNSVGLELSNKLQTKRNNVSVDLVDFRVDTSYIIKPKTGDKLGSNFSDFLFHLKLLPYSWLRVEADATYTHSGNRSDDNYNHFSDGNYDFIFTWAKEKSFSIGQRYQKEGGNQLAASFQWRLNPKWKFTTYHRYEMGRQTNLYKGMVEQQYIFSRNLHCWDVDFSINSSKKDGSSVWLIFRLKAFPETEFGINQEYHKAESGSQENP
jgi:lipopolysaccharide assembly outer membrane protein LptD (OstA)